MEIALCDDDGRFRAQTARSLADLLEKRGVKAAVAKFRDAETLLSAVADGAAGVRTLPWPVVTVVCRYGGWGRERTPGAPCKRGTRARRSIPLSTCFLHLLSPPAFSTYFLILAPMLSTRRYSNGLRRLTIRDVKTTIRDKVRAAKGVFLYNAS